MKKRWTYVFIIFLLMDLGLSQTNFFEKPNPFERIEVSVNGRVRMVSIKNVGVGLGKVAVVLVRRGTYPDLKLDLQFWKIAKHTPPKLLVTLPMPQDLHMYDVAFSGSTVGLVLIRDREWEWWAPQGSWENIHKQSFKLNAPFHYGDPGEASPFESQLNQKSTMLWIPSENGMSTYEFEKLDKPKLKYDIVAPIRGYYKSSIGNLAFEFPFWVRNSIWYPQIFEGVHVAGNSETLMIPWMDEVSIIPEYQNSKQKTVYFKRLTESEREDAQAYVVSTPADINGDKITDVIVNKFKGSTTQMTAETTLHYGDASGNFDIKGVAMKALGNRAAGAFPLDINNDGKTDLISASSQFNVWAIIQALTRRQVDVSFNIYLGGNQGIKLNQPSFTREITFGFDLTDLALKGFLPNLEGDFNGDGLVDAFYARNDKEVSVIVQSRNTQDLFPDVPSATYAVSVRRQSIVGDIDGDTKADVIMFDRRSEKNKAFTVLLNTGLIK